MTATNSLPMMWDTDKHSYSCIAHKLMKHFVHKNDFLKLICVFEFQL